ncbi:MAG: hypothetical protein ABH814_02830 [bacterium]
MRREDLAQKVSQFNKSVFKVSDLKLWFPREFELKTSIKRLKKAGQLVVLKRGLYALRGESFDIEKVATAYYYPSYVSFDSALAKYGIKNQGIYGLTLATTRYPKKVVLGGVDCVYSQLKKDLFFGYMLEGGVYVAEAEKAVLDQLYMISKGLSFDSSVEWDLSGLKKGVLRQYAKKYPKAVAVALEGLL